MHALLGGLISEAKDGDFESGVIAGGVAEGLTPIANSLLASYVSDNFAKLNFSEQGEQDNIATGQPIGLISSALSGGNPATGSLIGGSAEKYNSLLDAEEDAHKQSVESARQRYTMLKEEGLPISAELAEEAEEPIPVVSTTGLALGGARASSEGQSSAPMGARPQARNADDLQGGPLEDATKVSGQFILEGGPPNGTLYRSDNQGNITSYAVYGSDGMIMKRVDVSGAAHANVPTPHVIEYGRNILPDGSIRVQSPSSKLPPRQATLDEIP